MEIWTVEQYKSNRNLIEKLIAGEWDEEEHLVAERAALRASKPRGSVGNYDNDLTVNGWTLDDCRNHIKSLYQSLDRIAAMEKRMVAAGLNPYQ